MTDRDAVLNNLVAVYPDLSPQLKQAAKYVIDAPTEVAINSMRRIANVAGVGPSTMLRLTKRLGFSNYEEFRKPFQEAMRASGGSFADRAEWLRSLGGKDRRGQVLSGIAEAAISNIENAFDMAEPDVLDHAAETLRKAQTVYVFSSGALRSIAEYFYRVCRLVLPGSKLVDSPSGYPIDDLAGATSKDALLAISSEPYAESTVHGVEFARRRGVPIIAITDSRASPIARDAEVFIMAPTVTPQFFPSQVAVVALIE
ncbi:MAG: MurR/RpiR family transcriptional regulator, partial [Methyloligellaceae bacterium]